MQKHYNYLIDEMHMKYQCETLFRKYLEHAVPLRSNNYKKIKTEHCQIQNFYFPNCAIKVSAICKIICKKGRCRIKLKFLRNVLHKFSMRNMKGL